MDAIHKYRPQNFSTPFPLSAVWTDPQNKIHNIFYWANPSPPLNADIIYGWSQKAMKPAKINEDKQESQHWNASVWEKR